MPRRVGAGLTVGIVAILIAVGVLGDIRVGSGSDAGGKLATARVMADRWTCDPDIGWWAASADPEADLHQIFNTVVAGDRYLQATSPAYQCAIMPLQRAFGPWGPVSLSIVGVLATAGGAARIVRRLGGGSRGQVAASLLAGLAGPVAHYATDVWEHAPATGLMTVGIALMLGRPERKRALISGLCLGAAAALRAEAVVFIAVLAVTALAISEVRRSWLAARSALAAGAAALVSVVAANLLVERIILGSSLRAERGASLVEGSGNEAVERIRTAAVTGFGLLASDEPLALALGAGAVALALLAGWWLLTGRDDAPASLAGAVFALRWLYGIGFVPGALAAAPMANVGVFAGRRSPEHCWLVSSALLSLPAVWFLQWPGNLVAQWGGRYLLVPAVLLTATACASVRWEASSRRALAPLIVSCAAIGSMSAAWHVDRTASLGRLISAIEAVPPDSVVVSTDVNLAREAGGTYGRVRWLAVGPGESGLAQHVIERFQPEHVTLVRRGAAGRTVPLPSYRVSETLRITELGQEFVIQRAERLP